MLRTTFKAMSWLVGSSVALCVTLYLVVLAINWRDREPSAAARQFATVHAERPSVADGDNAFVYLMGFDAPLNEQPVIVGAQRISAMRQPYSASSAAAAASKAARHLDKPRSALIEEFREACRPGSETCAAAFEASDAVFTQWLAAEGWRLNRYRDLLTRQGWLESIPLASSSELPSYGQVMDGQALLLLQARAFAKQGLQLPATELLEQDHRFWRGVLQSSDTLITKMVATAGLNKNLQWGSLIVRQLQAQGASNAIPATWRTPIADSERSMLRCMAGELLFLAAMQEELTGQYAKDEIGTMQRLASKLLMPLFQRQASLNHQADHFMRAVELWRAPFDQYATAMLETQAQERRTRESAWPPRTAYNLVGQFAFGMGTPELTQYARRVGDIEGLRRAALTAATLRQDGVTAADVPPALQQPSTLRNPYDAAPFLWDEQASAVVFQGLQTGERGKHRIYY